MMGAAAKRVDRREDVITVLLVDDHPAVLEGLSAIISEQVDMSVLDCADSGQRAVDMAVSLRPDVVLMDVGLPDFSGDEATRRILELVPKTRVLGISCFDDDDTVSSMLKAGATGFVYKTIGRTDLPQAIRSVARGESVVPSDIADELTTLRRGRGLKATVAAYDPSAKRKASGPRLTSRECEVLRLTCDGLTAKEVGAQLGISHRTVEYHLAHIKAKLGLDSVASLVRYAIRCGLSRL